MPFLLTLFSSEPSISIPQSWLGRLLAALGWLVFATLVLYLLWRWRRYNRASNRRYWMIWFVLAVLTPVANLLIGIRLPIAGVLSPQNVPLETAGPIVAVFSALPWILAAGFLGPAGAASLAALAGLFQAFWNTHNPFTPIELALLGAMFGMAMYQRYRTGFYRLLRHPLFAALILSLIYPFIVFVSSVLATDGVLPERMDYALNMLWANSLALAIEMLIAAVFAEVVALGFPGSWGSHASLEPAPSEKSLQARFLQSIIPLILILLLALLSVNWVMAGTAARRIMRERMGDAALMASKGIPFFQIVGQNEIMRLAADKRLLSSTPEELSSLLADYIIRVPFFNQFYLLDSSGKSIGGYPQSDYDSALAPPDELEGIRNIQQGVEYQTYTLPPKMGGKAAQVSFITRISDEDGNPKGVLVGRADLDGNLFTAPILTTLQNIHELGGQSMLLDDKNRIIYHTNPALLMTPYTGKTPGEDAFFDDVAPNGTRELVYYRPIEGQPWAVVISVPAQAVQVVALGIAAPLLIIMALLGLITIVALKLRLNTITSSLQTLAVQADNIARGQLDEPLVGAGEDEVGQLRRAFEQMRISLKQRLEELNQLLVVVQGVASNLEMGQAVQPILSSALSSGAASARVALDAKVVPEIEGEARGPVAYSLGRNGEAYAYLDNQILSLARQQERLVLNNLLRPRLLRFTGEEQRPESLIAIPLRHESQFYGAMWVAYDQPHTFSEEEVRFIVTLAGQAALAAANARLFLNAEIGRQRLSAILAATPDPVLVTDQKNRLLLANPAVWRVLGMGVEWEEGKPIAEVINQKELLAILDGKAEDKLSAEITMPDQRVYYATATSIYTEGRRVGRVCILRDITSYKELDALKSEFVATVSHDLRSPLTLVRGYASMLEIVGELNESQSGYVRKMIASTEDMFHLVNDLLDLGRIEAGIGLQVGRVPVREVVDHVVNTFQPQATQKKIQLTAEISPQTVPFVDADQALLQQAVYNLVDNAVKFTPNNGKVHIRVEPRQDQTVFIVRDTGPGISPLDQPRIFERFFRSSAQSSQRQHGTGLGLAIVKSIADRHGGKVALESQLGKGSTFYLSIPTHHVQQESDIAARSVVP